jgi:hypothetical protein
VSDGEESLQGPLEASAGEAGLPVDGQGHVGEPCQAAGGAGGGGVADEQVGIEVGPGEGRGDGLQDPGVRGPAGDGKVDDLLGASERPGDNDVAEPEVDHPDPSQLDGKSLDAAPRAVGAREQSLDGDVQGAGEAEDLLEGRNAGAGLEIGDLLLSEVTPRRQGGLAEAGIGPGECQVASEMLQFRGDGSGIHDGARARTRGSGRD